MTMSVMTTDTISIEERLAEMTHVITKLTKTVEEKNLQIASLMSKVEAQVQNTIELSQVLTHPIGIGSPSDAPLVSKSVQAGK